MATTVLQAMVGAGKTEEALKYLSRTLNNPDKPFARVWVLLATKRQEVSFRQRLSELQDGRAVYFNAEFFNFYELNARILNLAVNPQRRITETARIGLLRKILRDMLDADELHFFKPIARTTGFLRVVADLITELKQNLVQPEAYIAAATSTKDRELALIYDTYQNILRSFDLVDTEGEGWLALEMVQKKPDVPRNVDLLLVDGYDQFTPVQAQMIAQLSSKIDEVIITLTHAPNKDDEINNVIGGRFGQALERLEEAHDDANVKFEIDTIDEVNTPRHPDLVALNQNIFSDIVPVQAHDGIKLIEAPDPQQETAAVLREVKSLMLSGVRADDILIALRDWQRYYTYFDIYGRQYNLPLLLHYGEPIANNPALTVLMDVLTLSGKDPDAPTAFRRRAVLDVLRSPYIRVPDLNDHNLALLEWVSQEKQVVGGRQNWLDAIRDAAEETRDEDGNIYDPLLTKEQHSDLSLALQDFFENIVPKPKEKLSYYVDWLEALIGQDTLDNPDEEDLIDGEYLRNFDTRRHGVLQPHEPYTLNIPDCIRQISDVPDADRIIARDTIALNQFKDLLRGMLSTQEFLRAALGQNLAPIRWQEMLDDIDNSLKNTPATQRDPIRSGRVLVTTATEARGLPHDYVFVLGLSEGIFPAELPEDPIYLDGERKDLRDNGVLLQTLAERTDDNGIFYELISLPRERLYLSRPYIREGKHWVESHLWRMTRKVFEDLQRYHLGIGDVVPSDEATSVDEVVLTVAEQLTQSGTAIDEQTLNLYQWLSTQKADEWQPIVDGREAESKRLSRNPHDESSGILQHPDLIQAVQSTLGNRRRWSASQLNDFGMCGYRFFAKRILKLEALEEPEEGLNALQIGLVNHAILEATYKEIIQDGFPVIAENCEAALEIFDYVANDVLRDAPQRYNFRTTALWREEQVVIKRRLQTLIELDFSSESPLNRFGEPRYPFALEMSFGINHAPAIQIPAADNEMLYVSGSIDRVDRIGDKLIVVDYKTGSSTIPTSEMEEGRNFQMMVYLLALQQLLQLRGETYEIAGGAFWHIRSQKVSGLLEIETTVEAQVEIQLAQKHVRHYLSQAREGNFAVQPTKIEDGKCSRYCDFYQLCRLANTYQYKQP